MMLVLLKTLLVLGLRINLRSKVKITKKVSTDDNTKDIKIAVLLKYFSNLWRKLEMSLTNCEINLILTLSPTCVITNSTCKGTFTISNSKFYIPTVTSWTEDNAKLLE